MWVKICANTNLEDALLAADLGADALGFVFAASPRRVTPAQVAAISPHLPRHVERVGVFTVQTAAEIVDAVAVAGLNAVQLPAERMTELASLLDPATRLVPVLHWAIADQNNGETLAAQWNGLRESGLRERERILIDSKMGQLAGGSGVPFDWQRAALAFASVRGAQSVMLAGGLRPANVRKAIEVFRPWGVDVASGVESVPGKKDPDLLRAFIENARSANASTSQAKPEPTARRLYKGALCGSGRARQRS